MVRRGPAGATATTRRAGAGDYEYERQEVCHPLLMCEPLRGWRHVRTTERRTRQDCAWCVREWGDVH